MRFMRAWLTLTVLITGSSDRTEAQPVAPSTGGQRPAWQQQMDEARRLAAAGHNYVMVVTPVRSGAGELGGVYVFYNNPTPFCYTYMIPGEWVAAPEPNAYRSRDGRAFVGVLFELSKNLEGVAGATLVERAGNLVTQQFEKALGQPLAGVELVKWESAPPGTWRWRAAPVSRAGRRIALPVIIIVDLSPDAIARITVGGTGDDDDLARRIVDSLRTTSDPECYWSVLERMLRAGLGDR